jgi:hypothetical protein
VAGRLAGSLCNPQIQYLYPFTEQKLIDQKYVKPLKLKEILYFCN